MMIDCNIYEKKNFYKKINNILIKKAENITIIEQII